MPRKPREIENLLTNKFGFSRASRHGDKHRWFELNVSGVGRILTMLPHSPREIRAKLEGKIARQLQVEKFFFDGMMGCSNNKDQYLAKLQSSPIVRRFMR